MAAGEPDSPWFLGGKVVGLGFGNGRMIRYIYIYNICNICIILFSFDYIYSMYIHITGNG